MTRRLRAGSAHAAVDVEFRHAGTDVLTGPGVAVAGDRQVTAEASAKAERVDPEVGEVRQVDRVGEAHVVAVGRRVELLPEPLPACATSFRREHVVLPRKRTPEAKTHREEPQGKR